MVDLTRSPTSLCERCPFDTRLCVVDNGRAQLSRPRRMHLRVYCPLYGVTFHAMGAGGWHLTDLGRTDAGGECGTVALARGAGEAH